MIIDNRYKKPLVVAGLILFILLIVLTAGWFFKNRREPGNIEQLNNRERKIQVSTETTYDPAKGPPEGFLANIPLDKPVNVVLDSSHTVTIPQGNSAQVITESTYEYITSQDVKTSADAYRNYFVKQGFKINFDGSIGNDGYSITGTKLQENILFVYSHNSVDQKNYVKLIYSRPELSQAEKDYIDQLHNLQKQQ